MTRRLLVVLATAAGMLDRGAGRIGIHDAAGWQCRGSAAIASVAGQNRVEPIVANGNINTANGVSPDRAQCVDSETGAGNTPTQLGIDPSFLGAVTGKASTEINPDLGRAIDQAILAEGRVEDLSPAARRRRSARSASARRTRPRPRSASPGNPTPQFSGDSRVADLTLGGTPIPLDQLVTQLTNVLNPILGALVEIKVDERIQTADSLTINALHVKVLRGSTPRRRPRSSARRRSAADGPVCDPAKQNDGSGDPLGQVCAAGSLLDAARNLCVIPAGTSGSGLGEIIIGRPFQGPSGGRVIPVDVARRRYGNTPCLSGNGAPKFAIVGTNRADRITGTNIADRIIGLGGNDQPRRWPRQRLHRGSHRR